MGGGQKLAFRAKVGRLCLPLLQMLNISQQVFEEICFPLEAECFHPLKRDADFVVSTAAKVNQESVGTDLDAVAHHDQIYPNEFDMEGIDNESHLNVNCIADDIDDAFFGKTVGQFGVEEDRCPILREYIEMELQETPHGSCYASICHETTHKIQSHCPLESTALPAFIQSHQRQQRQPITLSP